LASQCCDDLHRRAVTYTAETLAVRHTPSHAAPVDTHAQPADRDRGGPAIIDEEGLSACSTPRLAREFGCARLAVPPLRRRADIMSEVARLVVRETKLPPRVATDHWTDWFVTLAMTSAARFCGTRTWRRSCSSSGRVTC